MACVDFTVFLLSDFQLLACNLWVNEFLCCQMLYFTVRQFLWCLHASFCPLSISMHINKCQRLPCMTYHQGTQPQSIGRDTTICIRTEAGVRFQRFLFSCYLLVNYFLPKKGMNINWASKWQPKTILGLWLGLGSIMINPGLEVQKPHHCALGL